MPGREGGLPWCKWHEVRRRRKGGGGKKTKVNDVLAGLMKRSAGRHSLEGKRKGDRASSSG